MQLEAPRNEMEIAFARRDALIEKQEDLMPELEDYLVDTKFGFPRVEHPFFKSASFSDGHYAFVNQLFREHQQAADEALEQREWFTFVGLHEVPYWLQAFEEIADKLSDDDYWEVLGQIYTDAENLCDNQHRLGRLLNSKRPKRHRIMDETERGEIEELPTELTVYRGYSLKKRSRAWSWTLDEDKAEWFARRCRIQRIKSGQPRIAQGRVRKDDIVAYFSRREESEIVVDPKLISGIRDVRVN